MKNRNDLTDCTIHELLGMFSAVMRELRKRDIVRNANNPAADLAELLLCKTLSLCRAPSNKLGYDAERLRDPCKYQIKCRRFSGKNRSMELGITRGLEERRFDKLAVVIFEEDFSVHRAVVIPHELVLEKARPKKNANGHALTLRDDILNDKRVKDITKRVIRQWNRLT